MTHTVADAEAAVARHPDSLEQLSKAADLLIELGDPRGEDFSACLAGDVTGEEVMRRHPACRYTMFVAAWAMVQCRLCQGVRYVTHRDAVYGGTITQTCSCCAADPFARAEALRLLAECGRVGEDNENLGRDTYSYWSIRAKPVFARVPFGWWYEADGSAGRGLWGRSRVDSRLALIGAYAGAGPETRRLWADGTRKMNNDPTLC